MKPKIGDWMAIRGDTPDWDYAQITEIIKIYKRRRYVNYIQYWGNWKKEGKNRWVADRDEFIFAPTLKELKDKMILEEL